ncbi:MAG: TonB family protein [Vicinamibacterales bacterium]
MRTLFSLIVCLVAAQGIATAQCMPVGGSIPPPTKTVHVDPVYPPDALAAKIQGIVILQTTINAGVVTNASVLRSIPLLDAAAIAAVLQWRYTVTPGFPCVLMTVSVAFTLPTGTNPPTNLQASVSGNVLGLTWTAPAQSAPNDYRLEAGTATGLANLASVPLGSVATSFSAPVPNGTYFLRLRALYGSGPSAPSNEVQVTIGCTAPPPVPGALTHSVGPGGHVHFAWTSPSPSVTGYRLEAGTSSGSANLATVPLAAGDTSLDAVAPPGVYFVRVRAVNGCGVGGATADAVVTVGSACVPPTVPPALTVTATNGVLSASWSAPASGTSPFSYVIRAGTASGAANIGVFPVGGITAIQAPVPPGPYFLRVAAVNACGTSAYSNEASTVVSP